MKIMAVDDDGISLSLLKECLTEGGYDHTTFMSQPTKVLKRLADTAIPYDCILLDIEMPDMDGIKLCGEIRKLPGYKSTPILMITKRSDHSSVRKAFANGATDYITKPFEFFEVLTRIKVAERIVQERQAAIDSYLAVTSDRDHDRSKSSSSIRAYPVHPATRDLAAIGSDQFLSLSTFQNYLERMVQDRGCKIDLIALKIRQVNLVFESTSAAEFIDFLEKVAKATVAEFGYEGVFIAHAGNGMFLCARQDGERYEPSAKEAALMRRMARHQFSFRSSDHLSPPEFVVGPPVLLSTASNLNFRRAVKAASARMEIREGSAGDLNPLKAFG